MIEHKKRSRNEAKQRTLKKTHTHPKEVEKTVKRKKNPLTNLKNKEA